MTLSVQMYAWIGSNLIQWALWRHTFKFSFINSKNFTYCYIDIGSGFREWTVWCVQVFINVDIQRTALHEKGLTQTVFEKNHSCFIFVSQLHIQFAGKTDIIRLLGPILPSGVESYKYRAGKKSRFADSIGAKPTAPHAIWGARNKRFNATRHFEVYL